MSEPVVEVQFVTAWRNFDAGQRRIVPKSVADIWQDKGWAKQITKKTRGPDKAKRTRGPNRNKRVDAPDSEKAAN